MGDTPEYVISPETHFADAAAAASARVQTLDQAILAADCPKCCDNLKHFPLFHVSRIAALLPLQIVSVVSSGTRFISLPLQDLCEVYPSTASPEGGAN